MYNTDPDSDTSWAPPYETNCIAINGDAILFSDDTGISFRNIHEIADKPRIYDTVTSTNQLLVKWGMFSFRTR